MFGHCWPPLDIFSIVWHRNMNMHIRKINFASTRHSGSLFLSPKFQIIIFMFPNVRPRFRTSGQDFERPAGISNVQPRSNVWPRWSTHEEQRRRREQQNQACGRSFYHDHHYHHHHYRHHHHYHHNHYHHYHHHYYHHYHKENGPKVWESCSQMSSPEFADLRNSRNSRILIRKQWVYLRIRHPLPHAAGARMTIVCTISLKRMWH